MLFIMRRAKMAVAFGREGSQTRQLCIANAALSQLSYWPVESLHTDHFLSKAGRFCTNHCYVL